MALVVHGYKIGVTVATWFRDLIEIAHGVLILAGCVVVVCAIPVAIAARRAWAETQAALGRAERDLLPLLRELTGLARDLTSVAKTVRGDVELVHGTVADVNTRVQDVVRIAERRVGELDALLGVAQDEVEGILVTATAAARGVRAGCGSTWEHRRRPSELPRRRLLGGGALMVRDGHRPAMGLERAAGVVTIR